MVSQTLGCENMGNDQQCEKFNIALSIDPFLLTLFVRFKPLRAIRDTEENSLFTSASFAVSSSFRYSSKRDLVCHSRWSQFFSPAALLLKAPFIWGQADQPFGSRGKDNFLLIL